MEIFRKKLQPAEVKRHCVCVPKEKWSLFPKVGETVVIQDPNAGSIYEVIIGSQYRLAMGSWYGQHPEVQPGDEIIFEKVNGNMRVDLIRAKKPQPVVSLPGLIGKEIGGRKVVDIKHIPGKGTVLVVEETKEIPVDEMIDQLSLAK